MAENRVYLGEYGIIRMVCIGDQDEASARAMAEEMLRISKTVSGPPRVLFDTTRAGRFSVEARQLAARSLNMAKGGRAAVIAPSMPMRALGLFIAAGRGAQNVRVFETEREALSWLHEPVKPSQRRGIAFYSLLMAFFGMRWLRIKERWLREVFDVLGSVAMGYHFEFESTVLDTRAATRSAGCCCIDMWAAPPLTYNLRLITSHLIHCAGLPAFHHSGTSYLQAQHSSRGHRNK